MKTGLDRTDKEAYAKAYYQLRKEKIKQRQKEYYAENKTKWKEYVRAWRLANPEKYKEQCKRYGTKHKAEKNEYCRKRMQAWRLANPELNKLKKKEDYLKHKARRDAYTAAYSKQMVEQVTDVYVRRLLTKKETRAALLETIPQALIEAKRLQILIRRRVEDEERNTVKR